MPGVRLTPFYSEEESKTRQIPYPPKTQTESDFLVEFKTFSDQSNNSRKLGWNSVKKMVKP